MTLQLPKPARQAFAVCLLAAAVGAVALPVALPYYNQIHELQSQIDQERLVLGHLLADRGDDRSLQDIERNAGPGQINRLTLAGESDAIRMANLQSIAGGIAAAAGVQVRSTRNLPARDRGDVRLLGVQLQFAATIEQVQKILVAIEAQRPYLLVDGLQITALQDFVASGGGIASGGSAKMPNLDTRLDVVGAAARQKG